MNKNIDFNSKKFVLLLLIICLVFFIMIIKAFEYIPESIDDTYSQEKRIDSINQPSETNDNSSENIVKEDESKHKLNITLPKGDYVPEIEDIDLPPQNLGDAGAQPLASIGTAVQETKKTNAQIREESIQKARDLKKNKQYYDSLKEYQKVLELTSDKIQLAAVYEDIAVLYATVKKYGTALSFAQQAYNMEPTTSREILLARIYYKTGDVVKATQRINNVLQRDFAADR